MQPRSLLCAVPFALGLLVSAAPAGASERRTPTVIAVEKAAPSVVAIEVDQTVQSPFLLMGDYNTTSDGSGVIIQSDGVVLTNAHVVDGANAIRVHGADGEVWEAQVVGLETEVDLAVLRLEGASGLPTAELGTAEDLMLGEPVIAIGNPYGLGMTVSTGVVSSASREVALQEGVYQSYVQTDAAINPGNSGGALINIDGQLIGINTAIHAAGEGIGFAIPVDRAWKIAQDLVTYGSLRAPWLGFGVEDVGTHKLRGTPLEEGAVLVRRVVDGGPAANAGLEVGDLVYKADGRPVHSRADLNAYLAERSPGAEVSLSTYRSTTPIERELTSTALPEGLAAAVISERLGVSMRATASGLLIASAASDGIWARSGLRSGDLITAVDGRPVATADDLQEAVSAALARHRTSALFTVRRGRIRGTVPLSL